MRTLLSRLAGSLVRNRSRFPRWVNRVLETPARKPDSIVGRLALRALGGGDAPVVVAPDTVTRVLIAPTNYSGQAFRWARALENESTGIGARNVAEAIPGGFAFPADVSVPYAVMQGSTAWADDEWNATAVFTHVLIEAERPIFGRKFNRDVRTEVAALEARGASVAFMCHGTDIRDPDRHAAWTSWSPYPDDPRTELLRLDAAANLALLSSLARPTFVSTPDLLLDVPWAHWCPVVVDVDRFATTVPPCDREVVRVLHASSNAIQKGSHLIEPALAPLIADGEIELDLVSGVSAAEMPEVFARADIVVDQFRLGSYGVAACEAMAAGRVVIGHVPDEVRDLVRATFGLELPIVEATPPQLAEVVRGILDDVTAARARAAAGPEFVRAVHSGSASAGVLITHWLGRSDEAP